MQKLESNVIPFPKESSRSQALYGHREIYEAGYQKGWHQGWQDRAARYEADSRRKQARSAILPTILLMAGSLVFVIVMLLLTWFLTH